MADGLRNQPNQLGQWEAEAVGERLARSDAAGQIFVLKGLTPSHLHRDTPELRSALRAHGIPLFILDPTGSAGTGEKFLDILIAYVQEAEQRGKLSDESRHLFEFVSSANDQTQSGHFLAAGGNLYADTLCRLWTSLSNELPAVLVVVNAQHCPPSELKALEHLSSHFFSDPIEKLTPELDAIEKGTGRLVYLQVGEDFPIELDDVSTTVIDLSEAAEESVREFLADPKVVRRFIDSTGGDPRRLGELVESLPEDVQNFWLFRYDRLESREQALLNSIAVAGDPLTVDTLHTTMSLLHASDYFARSLRQLIEMGFVERKISSGVVKVHLESPEFATAVVESIADERRRAIHEALADAELADHSDNPSAVFLARHYLAAGKIEAGFQYGMRAARRLLARRAYDQAQQLLDTLLDHAESDEDLREIYTQLLTVHSALGNYRAALAHCQRLEDLTDEPADLARVHCQRGRLLINIGEYEPAVEIFQRAVESLDDTSDCFDVRLDARLGEAEALYAQGVHEEAEKRSEALVIDIQEMRDSEPSKQRALDMSLIQARNLIAKVAILRGECQQPRSLLEMNRTLATDWGWDDEIARAEANIGLVALEEKNFGEAHERLERALQLGRSPEAVRRAYAWINLGIIHQRKHSYEEALRYYLEALRASRQSGDDAGYGVAAHNLVTLYQSMGAFERAFAIFEHLRQPQAQHASSRFVGEAPTVVYGGMLLDQQRYEEALEAFARLTDAPNQNQAQSLSVLEARLRSIEAHLALGQESVAQRILEEFEEMGPETEQPQLSMLYDIGRAAVAMAQGDRQVALSVARQTSERARNMGHLRDALRASLLLAQALREADRPGEARSLLERELEELRQKAAHVPEAHRADFFAVPVHQQIVGHLQELDGEIPGEFLERGEAESDDQQESAPADLEDAAFQKWRSRYRTIVGEDPRLHQIFRIIDRVAESDSPVLLQGESGTGKELLAEAVHTHSNRSNGPMIKVNCAAFVEDLLLSELFGHVKGAFTGALADKPGRFELADGGTIFLDEIGDISTKTQVALLRVLQEGTFQKVGGTETKHVDVRVICATNKNLEEMVKRGEFRLDLYYRLKGVVMELPSLNKRRQDIPRLVAHFAQQQAGERKPKTFSKEVLRFLASYSWPGNIRELQNFVKSILLFVEGDTVEMSHLNDFSEFFADGEVDLELPEIDYEVDLEEYEDIGETFEDPEEALVEQIIAEGLSLASIKKRLELESIRRALIETGGNITRAAEILQMKRPRLSQIVNSTDELLALKEELVG